MLSTPTVLPQIDSPSIYIPSDKANLSWLEYVVQDFASGDISMEEACDLILRTQ